MLKSKSRKKPPTRVLALPDLEHAKTAVLNSVQAEQGVRGRGSAIDEDERLDTNPSRVSTCRMRQARSCGLTS
jgi:hypothetical protein